MYNNDIFISLNQTEIPLTMHQRLSGYNYKQIFYQLIVVIGKCLFSLQYRRLNNSIYSYQIRYKSLLNQTPSFNVFTKSLPPRSKQSTAGLNSKTGYHTKTEELSLPYDLLKVRTDGFMTFIKASVQSKTQLHLGFELRLSTPFLITIFITLRAQSFYLKNKRTPP